LNALDKKIQSLFTLASALTATVDYHEVRSRALQIKRLAQEIATAARRRELEGTNGMPIPRIHEDGAHELLTIPQFAEKVHRNRQTVYGWIRTGKMPPESVVMVQGHLEVNFTVYRQSIRTVA